MAKKQRKHEVHIVPGTHWDREWRYSFQETRQRLIRLLDRVLDILEKDRDIPSFTLDGQYLAVEDYLAVRPENRERLQKLVRDGRLEIGPWYSLPDMPVLMGESVVRNLFYGITLSREMGRVLMGGYTSSSWGQISQMPQICRGVGLSAYYSYHGVPGHLHPIEFWWEGPDGSRVLFIRQPEVTRATLWMCERAAIVPSGEDMADLPKGSRLLHNAYRLTDCPLLEDTPFYGDDAALPVDTDAFCAAFRHYRDAIAKDAATPHLLVGEFQDITEMHPGLSRLVKELVRRDKTGDKIHLSSMAEYFRKVNRSARNLGVFRGEMRFPAKECFAFRLCCPLSSRIYLKQANRDAEHLLTKWVEPFSAFAWLEGRDYPQGTLDMAWRMMLVNHAHDNIGGCSVDHVHDDMTWRYRQIREAGRALLHRSLGHLALGIGSPEVGDDEVRLIVFNPLAHDRSEVMEAYVDVPKELGEGTLQVRDTKGRPVTSAVLSVSDGKTVLTELPLVGHVGMAARRARVLIQAERVPAMGYVEYRLAAGGKAPAVRSAVESGSRWIANEFLKVAVRADGRLDLTDKATGEVYKGLHYFEDSGQDRVRYIPWYSSPPKRDKVYTSRGQSARVKLVHKSPLEAQLRVEYTFRVPKSLDPASKIEGKSRYGYGRRSTTLVPLSLVSVLTLRKGARRLDIETTLCNRARDHRLRVMFPTDVDTKHSWADSAYDVVRRSVARIDADDWNECRTLGTIRTSPMLHFVDVASPKRSLAVLVNGLPEYEVVDEPRRIVAVTLLRAFFNALNDPDITEPRVGGSQCLGEHTLRYALYPHKRQWDRADVLGEAYRFNVPLSAVETLQGGAGELPPRHSFIRFSSEGLVVTAVKRSHDGKDLIVRVLNPTERVIRTVMTCAFRVKAAHLADMMEKPLPKSGLRVLRDGDIRLEVPGKKVLTLRLEG